MKFALVVLALAMVHTAYAGGWFGRSERKVVDSFNNDPEVMDVKNIKVVDPKPWPKPYGGPKHEGAYEKPKYSAPKYEKDDDDEYLGGRGANRAVARALDDDDDDLYAPLYGAHLYGGHDGYGLPYGAYGDRDNNRNRNRNRNANANANANRDENNNRNRNNVKSKNAVEDAIYVIYLLNLYINLEY